MLQTLERGLTVLEWTVSHPGEATVGLAAQALELAPNTSYRLVNTLVELGYLMKGERGLLLPGPSFFRLWPVYLRQGGPLNALSAVQEDLRKGTGESTYLGIWNGDDVVVVSPLDGFEPLRVSGPEPGFRGYAHSQAMGKVILANLPVNDLERYLMSHDLVRITDNTVTDENELRVQLDRSRLEGVAYEYEELFSGACAMAVPLFSPRAAVVGAMAVLVPASRFDVRLDDYRGILLDAGEQSSRILGYQGPYPKREDLPG